MVGYNQEMLEQKARALGYAGDMENFPAFLEQNPMVAQRYMQEQNQPSFQAGGYLPQIPVGGPAVAQFPGGGQPNDAQKKAFVQSMGVPIGAHSYANNLDLAYNEALKKHSQISAQQAQATAAPLKINLKKSKQLKASLSTAPAPASTPVSYTHLTLPTTPYV